MSHDLDTLSTQLAALMTQTSAMAKQVTWLTQVAQRDHVMQGNLVHWPVDSAPSRPQRPDDSTQYVALRTAVLAAVQWHGWDRGPHDLGLVKPPDGSPSRPEIGSSSCWMGPGRS